MYPLELFTVKFKAHQTVREDKRNKNGNRMIGYLFLVSIVCNVYIL